MLVKVTGAGEYPGAGVLGEELAGVIEGPLGKPPWTILVQVSQETELGRTLLTATSFTTSGIEVNSDAIELDVEPVEIPPIDFSPQEARTLSVGGCMEITNQSSCGMALLITGSYPDGTVVSLSRSTMLKPVSQSPSIVAVSKDGSTLFGVSRGTAKVVVFDKYALDIKVY